MGDGVGVNMIWVVTNRRAVAPEIMDRPDVAPEDHVEALRGLERINSFSQAAEHMLRPIADMARAGNLAKLTLLDVACGGGDVPIKLCLEARRAGLEIELILVDRSATALARAVEAARKQEIVCRVLEADVLQGLPNCPADVVTSSLFLHHLPEDWQVAQLLQRMAGLARRMMVVSDLLRSRGGYLAAVVGCRLLSRSRIVHHDGPISVRSAWTNKEIRRIVQRAGLNGVKISTVWPRRFLLVWRRPEGGERASA